MAVTVKITETYDMKTTVNKVGIIGIHTPAITQLKKLYPGLMKNHKFVRFLKCDVVGASASALPADPLQVGVSSGLVAPEDMFNPILYTAVTNSSFDTLVARVRSLTDVSALGSVAEGGLLSVTDDNYNFKAYYGLLADNSKFRKVMPQSGFSIRNLVPLAHTVISTFGNVGSIGNTYALADDGETPIPVPDIEVPELDNSFAETSGQEILYRGKPIRMPRIPLHTTTEGIDDIPNPNIPKTTVLAMVLPPARLQEFWYRMRVSWTIRFEKVCSTIEAGNITALYSVADSSYARNYNLSSSKESLPVETDMVDGQDVEINKVMES